MEELINFLREGRIKLNVDWSYTYKYGEFRVLCHEVYVEAIQEAAARFGLKVDEFTTYK